MLCVLECVSGNFGDIDASTTDLAKLLFIEFALVYSNDWFVIPCTLPSGSLAQVRGMAVTNVFGERLWIQAADQGLDEAWGRWSMFTINILNAPAGSTSADTTLLMLPTLASAQYGPLQEEVFLVRDEVANMAWGVERTVPLASGVSRPGSEVAKQTLNYLQSLIPGSGTPPALAAAVRYQAMNSVPENWIPFIPVHVPNNNRQIQLQRAAMPRILVGDSNPAQKVQPLTSLLRQGLDLIPAQTYFLHEEEVPRAGARFTQYYARAGRRARCTPGCARRSKLVVVRPRAVSHSIAWSIRTRRKADERDDRRRGMDDEMKICWFL